MSLDSASIDWPLFNHLFSFSGLSPDLQSMEQIRRIMRPTDVPDTGTVFVFVCLILDTQHIHFLWISRCNFGLF